MGKNTKNFRQTNSSQAGNRGAQFFSKVNRLGSWYGKITNKFSIRGKKEPQV